VSRALDLLKLADELLAPSPGRPPQVKLVSAIEHAYYALFVFLIDEAVTATFGRERTPAAMQLRRASSRWYTHGQMKDAANWFRRAGKIPPRIAALLGYPPGASRGIVPIELERVATAFANLQEARHNATYDTSARFTRSQAQGYVRIARAALADWEVVAMTAPARLFLLLMLTGDAPVVSR
jgi:hypothetical protein